MTPFPAKMTPNNGYKFLGSSRTPRQTQMRVCHPTLIQKLRALDPRGVLDFGLDGGVSPGPRDPNPCLEVKKVPMFRDFAQKMDPYLGIF